MRCAGPLGFESRVTVHSGPAPVAALVGRPCARWTRSELLDLKLPKVVSSPRCNCSMFFEMANRYIEPD